MADVVTDPWLKKIYRERSTAFLLEDAKSLEQEYPEAYRQGPERQEYVARRYRLVLDELAERGVTFKGRLFPV
jgi:hypothetical protein